MRTVVLHDFEHRNPVIYNSDHIVKVRPVDPYRPGGAAVVEDVNGSRTTVYENVDDVLLKMAP